MKCALDPGAVVVAETAQSGDDRVDVPTRDFLVVKGYGAIDESCFWDTSEVDDHFE